MSATKFRPE